MNNISNHEIHTFPVSQNKQEFLIGIFRIKDIFKFTKYTTRLIVGFDDDELPIYNSQIQRKIENSRVKKIADFLINDPDATFPTNIVLHLPRIIVEEQKKEKNVISIKLDKKVFDEIDKKDGDIYISIIDGQHRIKGIEEAINRLESHCESLTKTLRTTNNSELEEKLSYYSGRLTDLKNIELVVSFFIDKTLEFQAMVFSTINRTQKRVSQSLVYSLFGLDTGDTPHKTALEVVLRLNGHEKSPFYKRIKLYGGNYSRNSSPPLSQATIVRTIVNLISENLRESENDRYKKRKNLLLRSEKSKKPLPFRNYYATNNDEKISDTLFYYFNSVRKVFKTSSDKSYWDFNDDDLTVSNIFHTTVGFNSLMDILVDILNKEKKNDADIIKDFDKFLIKAEHLKINDINRYSFNNRGKKFLYLDMSLKIWPPSNQEDERVLELRNLESDS